MSLVIEEHTMLFGCLEYCHEALHIILDIHCTGLCKLNQMTEDICVRKCVLLKIKIEYQKNAR